MRHFTSSLVMCLSFALCLYRLLFIFVDAQVPIEWYKEYDHVGYGVDGKKFMRRTAPQDSLDAFLTRMDDPNAMYGAVSPLLLFCQRVSVLDGMRLD